MSTSSTNDLNRITAERIQSLCKFNGITQSRLQKELGIKKGSFDKYISGENGIPRERLISIADYFDVSTDYLLGRCDYSSRNPSIADICKVTGLSEQAAVKLYLWATEVPAFTPVINDLICSESLSDLICNVLKAKYYIKKAVSEISDRPAPPPAVTYNQQKAAPAIAYAEMVSDCKSAEHARFLVYETMEKLKSTLLEMIDYRSIEALENKHFGGDSDDK